MPPTAPRPPAGGPPTRSTATSPVKPGQQAETFRKAAAEIRKAGAAPEVLQPVLAAEQEARQRQSEAKATSKLDAARNAAIQAQTSVEAAEAAVAAAGADGVAVVTAKAVSSHTDHAKEVESCKTTCYICRVKMYTSMKNK